MREPLYWKIKRVIGGFIRRLSHHYYGCCSNNFKNCNKCEGAIDEYLENHLNKCFGEDERSGSGE